MLQVTIKDHYAGINLSKYVQIMTPEIARNMNAFGRQASANLRRSIRSTTKGFPANSPPWSIAKGGKTVLYDTGAFLNSISYKIYKVARTVGVHIGIVDGGTHNNGYSMEDLAEGLQADRTWVPSPAQRRAFWAKVNQAGGYKPTQSSGSWHQPARDVFQYMKDTRVQALLFKQLFNALMSAGQKSKVVISNG